MMIEAKTVQTLKMHLFSGQLSTVFTIVDGACVSDLPQNLASFNPEHVCMYPGALAPDMSEVVPYVVILEQDSPFTTWILTNGWGKHCAVFGTTQADLRSLRNHFRTLLMVYDETGRSLYFRYYDPRVLRRYLPTCETDELILFFGPVNSYLIENEQPSDATKLFHVAGSLHQEAFPVH